MSRPILPPSRDRHAERTNRRVFALEKKLDAIGGGDYRPEQVFSQWGDVFAGEFGVWTPRTNVLLVEVFATLRVASTAGDVTFRLERSGIVVGGNVTIAEGALAVGPVRYQDPFSADADRLAVEVTEGDGTGAEDLTVICRFK